MVYISNIYRLIGRSTEFFSMAELRRIYLECEPTNLIQTEN
jgi:hypothetical protein